MNNYPEIKAPKHIEQDNSKMSLEDVQNYFDWFISIKDKRLSIFCKQVFESEQVELSPEKLQAIYYFFKENLTIKKRTPEEIEQERLKLPRDLQKIHKVPDYELIEPTNSIMFDAGIYYGELMRKRITGLNWAIEKDKKMAHYGKPVLIKKGMDIDSNPAAVFYVMALRIQDGTINEDFLIKAYEQSKNKFMGKHKDYAAMVERWSKGKS